MAVKTDTLTRLNIQIFWLFSTAMAFILSDILKERIIFLGWIAFLVIITIACIAVAVAAVRASRNKRYRMFPKELGQFTEIFDKYIALVPILGMFPEFGPVRSLFGELVERELKAYERRLVAHYSRG